MIAYASSRFHHGAAGAHWHGVGCLKMGRLMRWRYRPSITYLDLYDGLGRRGGRPFWSASGGWDAAA